MLTSGPDFLSHPWCLSSVVSPDPTGLGSFSASEYTSRAREAVDRFVALWGEMASTWGINRTMAKIHALLYCAERPLNTDEIMERLDVSRGNANMNLRALMDWDLVTKAHREDSRKDYYEAEKDVWQITARIIEERKRREVHPVRSRLEDCADALVAEDESVDNRPEVEQVLHGRLAALIDLMKVFESVSEALLPLVRNKNVDQIEQLLTLALQSASTEADDASTAR